MSITGLNLRRRIVGRARSGAVALLDLAIHWLDPGQPLATPSSQPVEPPARPQPVPAAPTPAPVAAPTATAPTPAPVAAPAPTAPAPATPTAPAAASLPPLPTPAVPAATKPKPARKRKAAEPVQPDVEAAPAPGPAPTPAPAPARSVSAEDRQKRHWERTRKGLLQYIADRGGSGTLRELHDHSEQTWFVAHVSFSRLMEELTGEGLLAYDHDTSVATITDAGRAAIA